MSTGIMGDRKLELNLGIITIKNPPCLFVSSRRNTQRRLIRSLIFRVDQQPSYPVFQYLPELSLSPCVLSMWFIHPVYQCSSDKAAALLQDHPIMATGLLLLPPGCAPPNTCKTRFSEEMTKRSVNTYSSWSTSELPLLCRI